MTRTQPSTLSQYSPGQLTKAWLWAEMLGLYFGIPALLAVLMDPLDRARPMLNPIGLGSLCDLDINRGWLVFPVLLTTTGTMLIVLLVSKRFDNRQLWNWAGAREGFRRVAVLFAINMLVMTALACWLAFSTDVMQLNRLFGMVRGAPLMLLIICVAYPVISAYPQEITHRAFFFHRYRPLFSGRWTMIVVNAVLFMWLHAMFWNWVALLLTLSGGLLFAYTYDRHRSTLLAGLEHGLYGNWAFATGLGWFVFTGSVGR